MCNWPRRVPDGLWWVPTNSAMDADILRGAYEREAVDTWRAILQPGMTVIDGGAHAGYYALLAAQAVGKTGHVIAYEPSAREVCRLRWHRWLNRAWPIEIRPVALGARPTSELLAVAVDQVSGCNSFVPNTSIPIRRRTWVDVVTLDNEAIPHVDVVKLDCEGAESGILSGARQTFRRDRPILACELHEKRQAPWGLRVADVRRAVERLGYVWTVETPDLAFAWPT